MNFGVRKKMVALLAVVAVLPLTVVLITVGLGWEELRTQTVGDNALSVVQAEALARRLALRKDIEKILIALHDDHAITLLTSSQVKPPPELLAEIDRQWPTMSPTSKPMSEVLNNPVVDILKEVQAEDPKIINFFVTDRFGQIVALSGRSGNYDQSSEDWWIKTYNNGKGLICIPWSYYDDAHKVWTLNVCVPVADSSGKVVGVARAEIDLRKWMMASEASEVTHASNLMLVRDDGTIIYRHGVEPLSTKAADWEDDIARPGASGWRTTGSELEAYTPLRITRPVGGFRIDMPQWVLVLYENQSQALGTGYLIGAKTISIGLVMITFLFLIGVWLIDRSIVSRVLQMQRAMAAVARGDMNQRLRLAGRRVTSSDELDQLAQGFNTMIDQVQRSTETLKSAGQLKTDFIRVAGHELRTPVSYILGMARLLKDSTDASRLLFAVQSMGAKAKRLNEIIQAMFKLMPDRLHPSDMNYTKLNLGELLEDIYSDVFPFIEKRSQRLIIETVDKLPELDADKDKFRDIIENLLMNAIKFTPDGGIIKIRASLQLGDRMAISVQDQGPGISEDEYPRLFQPFYGGSDVLTHSTGETGYQKRGIGLGLAVVRHFVEMHRGTIHVSSSPLGSTFTVTIPIHSPESPGIEHHGHEGLNI